MRDQEKKIVDTPRIERLKRGNWQFGHMGMHCGPGTKDCPKRSHHHHDEFCKMPSKGELRAAGIDPKKFVSRGRGDY